MNYILVICTLAVGHSLFSATAVLVLSKKLSNRLLAVLLFLLALRTGKSVVGFFFDHMIYGLSILGVIAMAAIGPVLYLLIRSLFLTETRLSRRAYLHFLPAAFLLAVLPWNAWNILSLAYYTITPHVLVYIGLSWAYVMRNRAAFRADDVKWRWALSLLAGISLLGATFVLQITVYQPVIYTTNVIVAAIVFYALSLWALKHARLFLPETKPKAAHTDAYEDIGKRIQQLFERDELFRDSTLTVTTLASRMKVQPYLVSRAVNHYFGKSFSELVMQHRIRKSEQLLLSADTRNYTIEAIAYESGFNTLSAFYAAFKKINHTTPAQFRSSKGLADLKIA
jgi:AraC-like DNA-binding protein